MAMKQESPIHSSAPRLLRSTLIAAGVALVLLFTTVLPAEYGVDPTGVGRVLGLTQMGLIKKSLAEEVAAAERAEAAAQAAPATVEATPVEEPLDVSPAGSETSEHVTTVILRPNEGKELKLAMRKGASTAYTWTADRGVVNYDAHGDSTGAPGSYHGYKKGAGVGADAGTLVAAFDGKHGWFWRNRTTHPITITLETRGNYDAIIPPK